MEYSFLIHTMLSFFSGAGIAMLTSWLNNSHYLKKKIVREYNVERFMKVYYPIMKIIYRSMYPSNEYVGLHIQELEKILEIVDDNMAIVDEKLEKIYWNLSEEKYYRCLNNTDYDDMFDTDKSFAKFIEESCHKLKKEINIV